MASLFVFVPFCCFCVWCEFFSLSLSLQWLSVFQKMRVIFFENVFKIVTVERRDENKKKKSSRNAKIRREKQFDAMCDDVSFFFSCPLNESFAYLSWLRAYQYCMVWLFMRFHKREREKETKKYIYQCSPQILVYGRSYFSYKCVAIFMLFWRSPTNSL